MYLVYSKSIIHLEILLIKNAELGARVLVIFPGVSDLSNSECYFYLSRLHMVSKLPNSILDACMGSANFLKPSSECLTANDFKE